MIIALEALAGIYLLAMVSLDTENLLSMILFKVVPLLLGVPLLFVAFARYMGWPL